MWPLIVIDVLEAGKLLIQVPSASRGGLHRQSVLQRLIEALDLSLDLRMIRGAILLGDPEPLQQILERVGPAFAGAKRFV